MTTSGNLGTNDYTVGGMYDTWGDAFVADMAILNKFAGDTHTVSDSSGTVALTVAQCQNFSIRATGGTASQVDIRVPDSIARFWYVRNDRASGAITVRCAAGGDTITLAAGERRLVYSDGSDCADLTMVTLAIASVTGLQAALDAKAALASPPLTGTPTAPTAAPGTNTTQLATTAFVEAVKVALLGGVAAQGDTLAELYALITDTDLAAIAALSTQAYGRSLLTAADATAARTLLEMAPQTVTASPTTNQNNYSIAGVVAKATKKTILVLTPTISLKFTGIDTTGWETGKELVIQNGTSEDGADSRLIILELNSASSSAANRFGSKRRHIPVMLMPGDEVNLRFDGTNLRVLNQIAAENGGPLGFSAIEFNSSMMGLSATGGTAAAVTRGAASTDTDHTIPVALLETGTTTTGRATDFMGGSLGVTGGEGALLFLSTIRINQLSTAGQEFDARTGFADGADASGIPGDGLFWLYDRNTSTNWQCRALNAASATTVDSGVAVGTSTTFIRLGVFLNGDATRGEFFYSTDMGQTWNFVSTAITTNLPNGRTFSAETGLTKSAGTTTVLMTLRSQGYRILNWS